MSLAHARDAVAGHSEEKHLPIGIARRIRQRLRQRARRRADHPLGAALQAAPYLAHGSYLSARAPLRSAARLFHPQGAQQGQSLTLAFSTPITQIP